MLRVYNRFLGLVRRYRVDRRLPPVVHELYSATIRLRVLETANALLASIRPPIGGASGPVSRLRRRRVTTIGVLDRSVNQLALDSADAVVETLSGAGLSPFVVEWEGDRITLGLPVEQRAAALAALRTSHIGWLIEWHDRGRSGLVDAEIGARRRLLGSRRWVLFQPMVVGRGVVGPEAGVAIGFWDVGSTGLRELVGTRAQEKFDPASALMTQRLGGRRYPGLSAFPVEEDLRRLREPVDIVYTWVDGADPEWQDRFRREALALGRSFDEEALDAARYRSRDELRYSMRSVWMYCGWARHIYLVTAGQRPAWLGNHESVSVIDHSQIMPPTALPTFNSHAIEASLHRIPGLSECFLYFNDDVFVRRPLRPETFFHPNGLARVFRSGARVPGAESEATIAADAAALRGRELLRGRFGRVAYDKPLHTVHTLRRTVLEEIECDYADLVESTRASRFRRPTDLSLASSLAQHFAIATQRGTFADINNRYANVESGQLGWHLERIRLDTEVDTFCINETADHRRRAGADDRVQKFFEALYPVAAPWERSE